MTEQPTGRAARPARAERAKLSEITTGIIISVISFLIFDVSVMGCVLSPGNFSTFSDIFD